MEYPMKTLVRLLPPKQRECGSWRENSQTHPSRKRRPSDRKAEQWQRGQSTHGPPKYTVQQTGTSPAVALFGKPIRDHLPILNLKLRHEWQEIVAERAKALAKRHVTQKVPQPESKELPPLQVGDSVQIQNQHGSRPTKWGNTGFITEVLPHRLAESRYEIADSWGRSSPYVAKLKRCYRSP